MWNSLSERTTVGRVLPERLDAVIHLQSPDGSIFCRLFKMLRRIFGTCKLPLTDFHNKQGPKVTQTGQKTQDTSQGPTRTLLMSNKQSWRERTNNPIQADTTFDDMQQRLIYHITGWHLI